MHWDRVDICEAYAVIEWDYNDGGWLQERPSNVRRGRANGYTGEATSIQLDRIGFRARTDLSSERLTANGREIYRQLIDRYGFREAEADAICDRCRELDSN